MADRQPHCESVDPDTQRKFTGQFLGRDGALYGVIDVGMARCIYPAGHDGDHKNVDGREWR